MAHCESLKLDGSGSSYPTNSPQSLAILLKAIFRARAKAGMRGREQVNRAAGARPVTGAGLAAEVGRGGVRLQGAGQLQGLASISTDRED